jgi:hypothetical protein
MLFQMSKQTKVSGRKWTIDRSRVMAWRPWHEEKAEETCTLIVNRINPFCGVGAKAKPGGRVGRGSTKLFAANQKNNKT